MSRLYETHNRKPCLVKNLRSEGPSLNKWKERSQLNLNNNQLNTPRTRLLDPISLKVAINEARVFLQQVREETGAPGLVVAVSVDGKLVWSEGLGYADLENNVKCTPKTVMRIASISKPLTAAAVGNVFDLRIGMI